MLSQSEHQGMVNELPQTRILLITQDNKAKSMQTWKNRMFLFLTSLFPFKAWLLVKNTCSWLFHYYNLCISRCVQAAVIGDVWNRISHLQRGGLQVPPQHADGEESPPALQGTDSWRWTLFQAMKTKNSLMFLLN